jgi:hypothetical protein
MVPYLAGIFVYVPLINSDSSLSNPEGLRNYFSHFGKVSSIISYSGSLFAFAHWLPKVDACTIMRDPSGTSKGFAFLTFEDPNVVGAVTAREHTLDGKTVSLLDCLPVRLSFILTDRSKTSDSSRRTSEK